MTFEPARQPCYSTPDGLAMAPTHELPRKLPTPSTSARRVELLDALRGFALLGLPMALVLDSWPIALFSLLLATRIGQAGVLRESIAHRRFWHRVLRGAFCFSLIATALVLHGATGVVTTGLLRGAASLAQGMFCVAAFVLLFQRPAWRRWLRKLAPAGRMAFTNCLAQTLLLCLGLLYGIGPRLDLAGVAFFGVALFALQVAFSCWWLNRSRFGPAEWLWHSLVGKGQQPTR